MHFRHLCSKIEHLQRCTVTIISNSFLKILSKKITLHQREGNSMVSESKDTTTGNTDDPHTQCRQQYKS